MAAGVLTLVLFAIDATGASAQDTRVCAPRATALVDQLGRQYGEHLTAAGVDANGGLLQVYSNPESGTWTIAVTMPGGPTCIVSTGEGFAVEQTAELPKSGRAS